MPVPHLIVHYHELALKGKNRRFFEEKLCFQIREFLKPFQATVKKISGRLLVEGNQGDPAAWQKVLSRLPGIANTQAVECHAADLETLLSEVPKKISQVGDVESFAIRARRDSKSYPFTSMDLEREIGRVVNQKTGWPVNLTEPDYEIFIEVVSGQAYVSSEKSVRGYRGLPVGVGGRGLVLLSGGFDSPVAAHLMQCRGLEVMAVHFHSAPLVSRASLDKVKEICEVLGQSQAHLRLALIPIVDFQKEVVARCPESLRVLLYRRFMMRLAETISMKWKTKTLITGDSLGQVASQTLENMSVISAVVSLPVLRPLVGLSKEWIIDKSKDIGTHDISVLPHDDCCGFLMPKKPQTKANLEDLVKAETLVDTPSLMENSLKEMKVITYECGQSK